MVFQNITFKHTNTEVGNGMDAYSTEKLTTLLKYVSEDQEAKAEVEYEKIVAHRTGPVCRVEVNIWVGGELYRAENTQSTFEAAVDVVRDELDQAMRRVHKKRHSLLRRGGRKIKEMMLFGKGQ
jgi:ribosomal subunit interface protein